MGGRCPEYEIEPDVVEEENYFFRLSRYADQLSELVTSRALRVVPESRHHEVQASLMRATNACDW